MSKKDEYGKIALDVRERFKKHFKV